MAPSKRIKFKHLLRSLVGDGLAVTQEGRFYSLTEEGGHTLRRLEAGETVTTHLGQPNVRIYA